VPRQRVVAGEEGVDGDEPVDEPVFKQEVERAVHRRRRRGAGAAAHALQHPALRTDLAGLGDAAQQRRSVPMRHAGGDKGGHAWGVLVDGGAQDDVILGRGGNLMLLGGHGNDYIHGGHDNDYFFDAAQNWGLYGGEGNAVKIGGAGDDLELAENAEVAQKLDVVNLLLSVLDEKEAARVKEVLNDH